MGRQQDRGGSFLGGKDSLTIFEERPIRKPTVIDFLQMEWILLEAVGFPRLATAARPFDFAQGRRGAPLVLLLLADFLTCKTKRPGLSLSPGTSVDQPSPKCCSRTTLVPSPASVNGPSVLRVGTSGPAMQCDSPGGSHFSHHWREMRTHFPFPLDSAQNKTPQDSI
jgi:hypothetical protein